MAEIRSTLDMVLERAAKMEAESKDLPDNEEKIQVGMKKAAAYLRGEDIDLAAALKACPDKDKAFYTKGLVQAFLRNIILPRDENDQAGTNRALQGLVEVGQGGGELLSMFSDMKSILDRYIDHKKELQKQLEAQFAQQMAMMEERLAQKAGVSMKLQPSQHPKFAEEWHKLQGQLNEQYSEALNQYKQHIEQRLAKSP